MEIKIKDKEEVRKLVAQYINEEISYLEYITKLAQYLE